MQDHEPNEDVLHTIQIKKQHIVGRKMMIAKAKNNIR